MEGPHPIPALCAPGMRLARARHHTGTPTTQLSHPPHTNTYDRPRSLNLLSAVGELRQWNSFLLVSIKLSVTPAVQGTLVTMWPAPQGRVSRGVSGHRGALVSENCLMVFW